MAFDPHFIDEVRARVGLIDLVGRRVALKRRGHKATGLCPFHKEKTPSFTVDEARGSYHCFGCAAHGSAFDFVMQMEALSFPEAVEKLAGEAGLALPEESPGDAEAQRRRKGLVELMAAATSWYQAQLSGRAGAEARRYLDQRGLDEGSIGAFRLGFAANRRSALMEAMEARGFSAELLLEAGLVRRPEDGGEAYDFFRDRIMFPITDRQDRTIAFGGRAMGEARAKYLNSPDSVVFQKGRTLYNLAGARKAAYDAGTVIVVEGYMDVIALHRAGIAHGVAPLGTALTEDQLRMLWRLAPEPVLCFDGDGAGKKAAERAGTRALGLLEPGRSLGFVELPPGEDPDSLLAASGAARLTALLERPTPLAELMWRVQIEGRSLDTPERRAGLRRDLARQTAGIGDPTVKEYYRQHFRERLDQLFGGPGGGPGRGREVRGGGSKFAGMGRLNEFLRPLAAHRSPNDKDASLARTERSILTLVLNHPSLLDEVFDDFASLEIKSPVLDRLHREIIESVVLRQALDVTRLKHDLTDSALRRVIDELLGETAVKIAPFARADALPEETLSAWSEVYQTHKLPDLEADLEAAMQALGREDTEANWIRFNAVKQEFDRVKIIATKYRAFGLDEAAPR